MHHINIAHQNPQTTLLVKICKQMKKILHGDDAIISGPENGAISHMEGFTIPHKCQVVSESYKYAITREKWE